MWKYIHDVGENLQTQARVRKVNNHTIQLELSQTEWAIKLNEVNKRNGKIYSSSWWQFANTS